MGGWLGGGGEVEKAAVDFDGVWVGRAVLCALAYARGSTGVLGFMNQGLVGIVFRNESCGRVFGGAWVGRAVLCALAYARGSTGVLGFMNLGLVALIFEGGFRRISHCGRTSAGWWTWAKRESTSRLSLMVWGTWAHFAVDAGAFATVDTIARRRNG